MQYHDVDTESGIVMAFRRWNLLFDTVKIKLNELSKEKNYVFKNLDDKNLFNSTESLEIILPQKRSCAIFEYKVN